VKFADDPVLLAKEETVLQGMIDKTDRNWKRISRQPVPLQIMVDQKQLENVGFQFFG
jgi:hypothetical protein